MQKLYRYKGPYYQFGKYVEEIKIETYAVSKARAVSNIKYQIKKRLGLRPNSNISILLNMVKEVKEDV